MTRSRGSVSSVARSASADQSARQAELFRATIFHTPDNPFSREIGDSSSLICHEDGGLLVNGGRVIACGDYAAVQAAHPGAATIDWRGGFLVPGFIDAHVHFPQLRILGAMGLTLLDWLERVALPEEARMADARYAADTARQFLRALASHGTTTALVFGAHFSSATAQLFEVAAASGLRIVSGLVLSDRLLHPDLHLPPEEAYRQSAMLIERYHRRGRLLYAVTPRFAISTSEAMLEVCQQLMGEHPDVRLQTHINENKGEIDQIGRLFPWARDYLAVYERYRLIGNRSVVAHNVHTTPSQLDRLAAAGTAVAHCPGSNAALGSGWFPLARHVERAGAEALGLQENIGDFREGKAADFVYLRPPADSVLESVVRHAESPSLALTGLFTLAGSESVREVRVEGQTVFAMGE
jgi:guanine deaminase